MKLKSTALALTVASVAIAATPQFSTSLHDPAPVSTQMQGRTLTNIARQATSHFSTPARKTRGLHRSQGYTQSQFPEIEKMGTLELVIEEDFSLLTTGSYETPDLSTRLEMEWGDGKDYRYPYTNFNRAYTHVTDWGAGNCFPAGGSLYFNCKAQGDQAKVNTPMLNVASDGGIAVVEFKARSKGGTYPGLLVETAETNNMAPSWRFYDDPILFSVDEEWQTYRAVFIDAGPTTIFQICGIAQGEVFVDDIKVYHMKPYAGIPRVLAHTDYERDGFTANWASVPGAEYYLLSLWSVNPDATTTPILEDEIVRENSFRVLKPEGDEFGYTVKSVNGDHISYESKTQNVYDIVAPNLLQPEIRGNQDFTGKWEELDLAAGYSYWVYNERTAKTTGEFVVTNEDFTGVAQPDGTKTEFTIENPSDLTLSEWYPTELRQRGWKGKRYAPYKDFICLDGWWYYMGQGDAAFISPEMDFSKDGGKFTLSARLAGRKVENPAYDPADPTQPKTVTSQACVALFNWNDSIGDYEQVELVYLPADNPVRAYWRNFSFNLTKGSKRSVVGIFAIRCVDNLYIDDLRITQNYNAGEFLIEPFYMHPWTYSQVADEATAQPIAIPDYATDGKIYHKVSAARAKVAQNPYTGDMEIERLAESKFSPLTYVMNTTPAALETLPTLQARAFANDGTLTVHNPAELPVDLYSIDGRHLRTLGTAPSLTTPILPGAYIVTIGPRAFKVID